MKSKNLQPRLLYPAKLSFRIEGHRKSFPDKIKLKEFITTKPVLYRCQRVFFKKEKKMIKDINNKMAINTYLSKITSKKQNKGTSRT